MVFDRAISYELTPRRFLADSPGFVKTTMVLNPFQVHERWAMFERLWEGAVTYEAAAQTQSNSPESR